jgi:hypothetical protein
MLTWLSCMRALNTAGRDVCSRPAQTTAWPNEGVLGHINHARPHQGNWAACTTTTAGARMGDHHIPDLLDGVEYSARTDVSLIGGENLCSFGRRKTVNNSWPAFLREAAGQDSPIEGPGGSLSSNGWKYPARTGYGSCCSPCPATPCPSRLSSPRRRPNPGPATKRTARKPSPRSTPIGAVPVTTPTKGTENHERHV